MNVYDFDGTIYEGDSTIDFYIFSLKNNLRIARAFPRQCFYFIKYKFKLCTKEKFKEEFYTFLSYVDDIDYEVESFWKNNRNKICSWYYNQSQKEDIIITASPEFLIKPLKSYLGISEIIASKVDKKNGKLLGKNCYGEEKVKRFKQKYSIREMESFYTDSISDLPMAKLAQSAFMVKNGKLLEWKL